MNGLFLSLKNNSLSQQTETTQMTPESFINKIWYYTTAIKLVHLKVTGTGSQGQHLAFADLYDFMTEFADRLTETYQSGELLDICHEKICSSEVSLSTLDEIIAFVDENSYVFPKSYQRNLIDTLSEELAQTKYKIKHLND